MIRRVILVALALFCLVAERDAQARNGYNTTWMYGNEHYEQCQHMTKENFNPLYAGYCTGYVLGVLDTLQQQVLCVPVGVTRGQLTDIVRRWLRDNPDKRHASAHYLVAAALKEKFPC